MIVPLSQLAEVAAQAVTALQPAFDRSDVHHAAMWVERVAADHAQLWRHGDVWAITEVQDTKTGRVIHVVAMAGPQYSVKLGNAIEQWGASVGCNKCYFTGRRGWIKRLPDYRIKTVTFEKELTCQKQ